MLLVAQILGGLTGIGIVYACYCFDERKHDRILKQHQAKHNAELEEIRKQKERIRNNYNCQCH